MQGCLDRSLGPCIGESVIMKGLVLGYYYSNPSSKPIETNLWGKNMRTATALADKMFRCAHVA